MPVLEKPKIDLNERAIRYILALPRPIKRAIALGIDAGICAVTVYLAFYLRLGVLVNPFSGPPHPTMGAIALALPIFIVMGLYRAIFRHAGYGALVTIAQAIALYAVPYAMIYTVIGVIGVPKTIGLIQPILMFFFVAASRLCAKAYLGDAYQSLWNDKSVPRALIYGAGRAGRQLASVLRSSGEMRFLGFIDDDPQLWRSTIDNTAVHSPDQLPRLVRRHHVTDLLLAVPSANRSRRAEIVAQTKALALHVRTLPSMMDVARGSVSVSDLRDLEIDDLLGRSSVPPERSLIGRDIAGKTVLVTGAGGSIGSELCRQVAALQPARMILVDHAEFNLYSIHRELVEVASPEALGEGRIVPILGSVCDPGRMEEVVTRFRPDTIYHAAAYKHVPLVEFNATEGIANNVFGTMIMAQIARRQNVPSFTLISTDKAVRPTNIMGTTKRLAEMILQALAAEGGETRFSMVRFGNVLGSSGSVVPLFRAQIQAGGPVTITDPRITRYFMTIPEAAQLVLQAGAMATGGDVFLLEMGEPVLIIDLARNMIELSGLTVCDEANPDGDIAIEFVGLRPGEKLYEELLIGDNPLPTKHPRILRSTEEFTPWADLEPALDKLLGVVRAREAVAARDIVKALVPEFAPSSMNVDWLAHGSSPASGGQAKVTV